jgi:CheY-like chemotaxis protein
MHKTEILCVDDDPQVLEGLYFYLRRHYTVHQATSGAKALEQLRSLKNIAVIVSDMRMPDMDGAQFLALSRPISPNSVRLLLTGYADVQSAIAAVNDGQIFRFISKPCSAPDMLVALAAAADQHRLIVAEKVLLRRTLLGCVESLAKVLSLSNPSVFGRALRLRSKTKSVLRTLNWEETWAMEAAAMLSQLGAVTLSEDVLLRLNQGQNLEEADLRELSASVGTSIKLLENIPRLEPVIAILQYLAKGTGQGTAESTTVTREGRLMRIVLEWDLMEARGYSKPQALQAMSEEGTFDNELLNELGATGDAARYATSTVAVLPSDFLPGMILAQDLVRPSGAVLLPRGFEIEVGFIDHIKTFAQELDSCPVNVFATASMLD